MAQPTELLDGRLRRSLATRRSLQQAALRLFLRRGFEQTTIDEISEAAGVSPRTFFRHFDTKEDVLVGDQEAMKERLAAALAGRPTDEPLLLSVKQAMCELAEQYEGERDEHLLRARVAMVTPSVLARSAEYQRSWELVISEACAARLNTDPGRDIRPALIAAATIAALGVAFMKWVDDDGRSSLDELLVEALDLLYGDFGLGSPA